MATKSLSPNLSHGAFARFVGVPRQLSVAFRLARSKLGWIRYVCIIEQLLAGQHFEHPPTNVTLAQAERVQEQWQRDVLF